MKKLLFSLIVGVCAATSVQAELGKEFYEKSCARCHASDGSGKTKMGEKLGAKDYTNAKVQTDLTDVAAVKAIKDGVKDKEGKVVMKAVEGVTDADIKGLVAYMRAFKK